MNPWNGTTLFGFNILEVDTSPVEFFLILQSNLIFPSSMNSASTLPYVLILSEKVTIINNQLVNIRTYAKEVRNVVSSMILRPKIMAIAVAKAKQMINPNVNHQFLANHSFE